MWVGWEPQENPKLIKLSLEVTHFSQRVINASDVGHLDEESESQEPASYENSSDAKLGSDLVLDIKDLHKISLPARVKARKKLLAEDSNAEAVIKGIGQCSTSWSKHNKGYCTQYRAAGKSQQPILPDALAAAGLASTGRYEQHKTNHAKAKKWQWEKAEANAEHRPKAKMRQRGKAE